MEHFDILRKETQPTCCLDHFLEQFSYRSINLMQDPHEYDLLLFNVLTDLQDTTVKTATPLPYLMANYSKVV